MTRRDLVMILAGVLAAPSCGGRSGLVGAVATTSGSDAVSGATASASSSGVTSAGGAGTGGAGAGGAGAGGAGAGGASAPCGPGAIACGGACVDTQHDPSNCGACGVMCAAPVPCIAGNCPSVPTTGLVLWLAANQGVTTAGGSVQAWADQSGSGNDVAPPTKAPTYVPMGLNGLPTVHFDGKASFLTVPDSPSLDFGTSVDFTVIVVVSAGAAAKPLTGIVSKAQHTDPAFHGWQIHVRDGSQSLAEEIIASPFSGSAEASTLDIQDGVFRVLTVVFQRNPGHVRAYAGGAPIQSASFPQLAGDLTTPDPLVIGTERSQVNFMQGDVAELMIYAGALSDLSRVTVETYLSEKYGIP